MQKIFEKNEDIAFGFLIAWCSLPIVMSFYTVILSIQGELPSFAEIKQSGNLYGSYIWNAPREAYVTLFCILGALTLIYALFVIIAGLKHVKDKNNIKTKPWYYLLLLVLIQACISSFLSDDFYIAMFEDYLTYDNLCSYFIYASVFFCASLIKTKEKRLFLIKAFIFMVLYNVVIMFLQDICKVEYLLYLFPSDHAAVFINSNHLGYMTCMALIGTLGLYLYENKKVYLVLFAIFTYALIMNDTYGCYLASVVAFPFTYIVYKKSNHKLDFNKFLPLIAFVIISLLSAFGCLPYANGLSRSFMQSINDVGEIATQEEGYTDAGSGRLILWLDTIERIKQRPIFGFGPNGFSGKNMITGGNSTHNEYLEIAGYLGIPGLLFYLSALITLCVNKFRNLININNSVLIAGCVLFTYLGSAFFGSIVFNTHPYYWMFFGLTIDNPLIDLTGQDIIEELNSKSDKKHLFTVVCSCLVICLVLAFGFIKFFEFSSEKNYEEADIQALNVAKSRAIVLFDEKKLKEETTYYLNPTDYSLVETKPKGYGLGTDITGGGNAKFKYEWGKEFEYDESLDYSNKVVRVIVHSKNDIEVAWVD